MSRSPVLLIAGIWGLSCISTGLVRQYALQRNLLDLPNSRSSHVVPTPRGGGIAIVFAFFVAVLGMSLFKQLNLAMLITLVAGGGAIAFIGFLDDRLHLPAALRFGVHLSAASLAVLLLGGIPEAALTNWDLHGIWVGAAIAVLMLVWATNLFNFMDGIDGIAGSEAIFVTVAGAWLNWHQKGDLALSVSMLCLAAASHGFLIWNWPPARIFMGDVGSGFLGFTVAVLGLAMSQSRVVPIEVWGILGGVFLVDATVTLIRRILRGDRWFEAHRMHAYQHLSRRWNSHLPVTLLVSLINVIWLLPWAFLATRAPECALWCLLSALSPLIALAFVFGAGSRDN